MSTQALASQNNIDFSSEGYVLITVKNSTQFQCVWAAHDGVGKDRARPTEVFHCVRPIAGHTLIKQVGRTLMAIGVYDLGIRTKQRVQGNKTIHWLNLN